MAVEWDLTWDYETPYQSRLTDLQLKETVCRQSPLTRGAAALL